MVVPIKTYAGDGWCLKRRIAVMAEVRIFARPKYNDHQQSEFNVCQKTTTTKA